MTLAREVLGARGEPAALNATDTRHAVARDERGVLAVRADPDVGTIGLGQHVEHRSEVEIDPEAPQLARLEEALAGRERFLTGGAHREVVREDRRARAEHDDPSALVIGGDEQAPAERALEAGEQGPELLWVLEVPPIENQPAGARLAEEIHVGVAQLRSRQADHQPLADEIAEISLHRRLAHA